MKAFAKAKNLVMDSKQKVLQAAGKAEKTETDQDFEVLKEKWNNLCTNMKEIETDFKKQKLFISIKQVMALAQHLEDFYATDDGKLDFGSKYKESVKAMENALTVFVGNQVEIENGLHALNHKLHSIRTLIDERKRLQMEWEKARAALASNKDPSKADDLQRKQQEATDQFNQHDQKTKMELREAISKRYVSFDEYYKKIVRSQAALFATINGAFQMLSLTADQSPPEMNSDIAFSPRTSTDFSGLSSKGEEDKSPLRIGTRDSDDGTQLPSSANISRSSTNEHENLNTTTTSEELLPTPYFGRPLSEIGGVNKMPVLVEDAINYLSDPSILAEEGLLRLSGSKKDIDELRDIYNSGRAPDVSKYDPHAITGLLKQFFRELISEPLIPHHLNQTITKIVAQEQDPALINMISPALVLQSIKMEVVTLIESLPETNYAVLKSLIRFFVLVEQNSAKNKMNMNNILTVTVPSLQCHPGLIKLLMEDPDFFFVN